MAKAGAQHRRREAQRKKQRRKTNAALRKDAARVAAVSYAVARGASKSSKSRKRRKAEKKRQRKAAWNAAVAAAAVADPPQRREMSPLTRKIYGWFWFIIGILCCVMGLLLCIVMLPFGLVVVALGAVAIHFGLKYRRGPQPPAGDWDAWDASVHEYEGQADRMARAMRQNIVIGKLKKGKYEVTGTKGDIYLTDFDSCTCMDFTRRHLPCKHMYALADRFTGFDAALYLEDLNDEA